MADVLTQEQRHKNMKNIRSKNTKIERILRKALWERGIRYRKNYSKLPGKPDIVLKKYKILPIDEAKSSEICGSLPDIREFATSRGKTLASRKETRRSIIIKRAKNEQSPSG